MICLVYQLESFKSLDRTCLAIPLPPPTCLSSPPPPSLWDQGPVTPQVDYPPSSPPLPVTAYFDLSSYLYLSLLIHDASLIIYELSVPPAYLHHVYIRTCARVNAYRTYLLSRYLAVNYLTSQRVFSHSTYLFRTHIPTPT